MEALSIEKLSKTYKGKVKALDDISFSVKEGEFYALLGPNGAGKTTTIGIISSLVNKSKGKVTIFGKDLEKDRDEVKTFIGLVPQEFNFSIFEKVFDIVVTQAGYYGIPKAEAEKRAEELLKKLNLWHKKDMKSMTLSGGMKRKLMIVRALMHKPKLLILDEPTAGVDVETRREMWDFFKALNKQGTTIILTTHYLEEAEQLCKRIGIIDKGKLILNTSMKALLSTLDKETFILDTKGDLTTLKPLPSDVEIVDKETLKVVIPKDDDLNTLFTLLSKKKITVLSMRNEANRLEELFVQLVKKK